jgi:hypothetical protein
MLINIILSFRRMPDKSTKRVERLEGGPQGGRSESSREINSWTPAFAGVKNCAEFLYQVLFFSVFPWIPWR